MLLSEIACLLKLVLAAARPTCPMLVDQMDAAARSTYCPLLRLVCWRLLRLLAAARPTCPMLLGRLVDDGLR